MKQKGFAYLVRVTLVFVVWCAPFASWAGDYDYKMATSLGDKGDDVLNGARIQSDGTIVIAGVISKQKIGAVRPVLLNGATVSSQGVVIRLSFDGKKILSVTRVGAGVFDMALDSCDNIYVAAAKDGILKLDARASRVLWSDKPGFAYRLDVSKDGHIAVLRPSNTSDPNSSSGAGKIAVYSPSGKKLVDFSGHRNTTDLCVDEKSKTVVTIGWRQARAFDGKKTYPVQIAYMRGSDYGGKVKWTSYDWSTDRNSPKFLNKPTNNMADSRGYRCSIGDDGKLYAAFEVAGGNHIFRYSPFDINKKVKIVGGDHFHSFHNSKSEHKTFFARYEPATGQYLLGQQLCARLSSGRANTVRVKQGEIIADSSGRVLLGGASASGFPFTYIPPASGSYRGGSYMIVMSADFKKRLYASHITASGETRAVGVRTSGSKMNIVFVGLHKNKSKDLYTLQPLQSQLAGGTTDAFAAVTGGHSISGGKPSHCASQPPKEQSPTQELPEEKEPVYKREHFPPNMEKTIGQNDAGSSELPGAKEQGQSQPDATGTGTPESSSGSDNAVSGVDSINQDSSFRGVDNEDKGDPSGSASEGCSCSGTHSAPAGFWFFILLGAFLFSKRRFLQR